VLFGIFIYPGVEPIDLSTFGVLSMAKRIRPEITICTIAPHGGPTVLSNGLCVLADYWIARAPRLVTGGPCCVDQSRATETLAFIRRQAAAIPVVSVCTGSMILAASGILDGKAATTKRVVVSPEPSPLSQLRAEHPRVLAREASLVDAGSIITGGGVSLCIDTVLHLLKRLFGPEMAAETARMLEYHHAWQANREKFPPFLAAS